MPEPPLPGDRFEAAPSGPDVGPAQLEPPDAPRARAAAQPEPPDALRAPVVVAPEPPDAVRPQAGAARR